MRANNHKNGLTLIEILIVVGIIAVLTSVVIGIARRVDDQGKERLVEDTFAILAAALSQFADYGYTYDNPAYAEFKFPLDCNGFGPLELVSTLQSGLNTLPIPSDGIRGSGHNDRYSGSEAMYLLLSQVPECRKTLERIDESLITKKGEDKNDMDIVIGGKTYPLLRVIDPWEQTLRYDHYYEVSLPAVPNPDSRRTFPVITSAGPDRRFGTRDDISSK